jgi:MFS family permease
MVFYVLFQVSMNTAYGPFQAFIPDMIPSEKRGIASGTKALFEMAGIIAIIFPVSLLMDRYFNDGGNIWLFGSLGLPGIVLLTAMLITVAWVKERPAQPGTGRAIFSTLLETFKIDIKKNRSFLWFVLSRLLVFMALTTLQQFAFNFLIDVIGITNPAEATARFAVLGILGIIAATWPAGILSDKLGRKPVCAMSIVLGIIGLVIILVWESYTSVLVGGGLIGIAVGGFYSSNWALATDLVPEREEGHFLGLTNIAVAGGAALSRLIGPVIDPLNSRWENWGYRAMFIACILYLAIGALLLTRIDTGKKGVTGTIANSSSL